MEFITNPLYVLTILSISIVVGEWLVANTFCKHLGTALLVILMGALLANLNLIPTASNAIPLYDVIFGQVAPISIFYLLLAVNLRNILAAGLPMLMVFLLGSVGTVLGVLTGMWVIGGAEVFGDSFAPLAGMFTGTYTGGSINFNAVALEYGVVKDGTLYAGSVAVDNIITTIWMLATIALPRILHRFFGSTTIEQSTAGDLTETDNSAIDRETVDPRDLGLMIALGAGALWISNILTGWFASAGINVPSILIITTIALILAQIPAVSRLSGAKVLGMYSVYLFLAVIGAYCEVAALGEIGKIGTALLGFALILVIVHALVTYGIGGLFFRDWEMISIASQANIGGSTTALALAKSLERNEMLLPAILVGSLGNGIGTYLGFLMVGWI